MAKLSPHMKTIDKAISSRGLFAAWKFFCKWCLRHDGTEREAIEGPGNMRTNFSGLSTLPVLLFLGFSVGFLPAFVPTLEGSHNAPPVARFTLASTFSPVPREIPVPPSIQSRAPGPYAGRAPLNSATSFYKGKTVRVIVPVSPGGSFDLWARLLARHLGKHLPGNPRFIVQNKTGGGGLVGANYLYRLAKPDGLTIGTLNPSGYLDQIIGRPEIKYNWPKFSWIGATDTTHEILYVRADAPYRSLEDVIGASMPPVCGSIGVGTTGSIIPKLIQYLFGARFKIVAGYRGGVAVDVAVERGEVNCRATLIAAYLGREPTRSWQKQGFTRVLIQTGRERHAAFPEVPTIWELAERRGLSDEDRRLMEAILAGGTFGVPFVGPPVIPEDHLGLLRNVFMKTMRDREFRSEAVRMRGLEARPVNGHKLEELANRVMDLPPKVVKQLQQLLFPQGDRGSR